MEERREVRDKGKEEVGRKERGREIWEMKERNWRRMKKGAGKKVEKWMGKRKTE